MAVLKFESGPGASFLRRKKGRNPNENDTASHRLVPPSNRRCRKKMPSATFCETNIHSKSSRLQKSSCQKGPLLTDDIFDGCRIHAALSLHSSNVCASTVCGAQKKLGEYWSRQRYRPPYEVCDLVLSFRYGILNTLRSIPQSVFLRETAPTSLAIVVLKCPPFFWRSI